MGIPDNIITRKGAKKVEEIPSSVLDLLSKGLIETVNLVEWLAVDQHGLVSQVLGEINKPSWQTYIEDELNNQAKPTANSNTRVIGQALSELTTDLELLSGLSKHTSDVVRSWACWALSIHFDTIEELLENMLPFAADHHFGVREVVIFATKNRLSSDLSTSIEILSDWASFSDDNVRRYAVEVMRPIGVWTKKIKAIQVNPDLCLPILSQLKSDPSKYVQNAVGNWLNDASKSQPDWVEDICQKWSGESETKETAYIVKRGLRTINKSKSIKV